MLRICGILLLSAIPVGIGWIKSRRILKEQEDIQGALFLVTQFRQRIAYGQVPVLDIVRQMPKNQYRLVDALSDQMCNNVIPKIAWDNVSQGLRCQSICDIMRDLFESLGVSDCASQLQICDMTIDRLESVQTKNSEEIIIRSKLSRTIGMLAGTFIAIILL